MYKYWLKINWTFKEFFRVNDLLTFFQEWKKNRKKKPFEKIEKRLENAWFFSIRM